MGLDKITTKLQEALQAGQRLASKSAHPELKSAHVLLSLLQQEGGIATPILQNAGVDVTRLKAAVAMALDREPRQEGSTTQPQLSCVPPSMPPMKSGAKWAMITCRWSTFSSPR
jgi:ATP-dependent Clp protease ATP-binding subunit ClpB